jgi:HD-GYP domain-containing protein (c-di-GMP phosphodiesterase class II)
VVVPTERVSIAAGEPAEPVVRLEPPAPRRKTESSEASEPLYGEIQRFLVEARDRIASSAFPWGRLDALIERAATSLLESPDLVWVANNPGAPAGVDYVAFHQARVCVLALRLAVNLGYDRARLKPLGMAAALFDVGLWQLPPALLDGETRSGSELATYRSHPRLSAEIVERWSPPDGRIVAAIADHHERELGQGFPRGVQGGSIDHDAKIIGLADAYTAMTVPPPSSRPRLRPHEAIRDIVKTRNDQFPSALIKVLLAEISVFPPGTIVRLNTEEVGRVIAVNRNHPLRPQVEIVADGKGQRLPVPKVIDLSESPFLYITGPVGDSAR